MSLHRWMFLALLPFLWCALINRGFFASDEYWTGITRYIPAQTSEIATLVEPEAVKSPSQLMPFYLLGKVALSLGIEHPYYQYCFILSVLGLLATGLLFLAFFNAPFSEEDKKIAFLLLGFHFASAICFTRPMFETLSAPFVAWAGLYALRYDNQKETTSLVAGVIFSSLAFLLRPQAGAVALTFVVLPLWKKQWRQFLIVGIVGLVCFVATGLLDKLLMGEFHGSLKKVLFYNVEHGAEYGEQPFYYFFPLLFLLGLGFWTLPSYFKASVRSETWKQKSLILTVVIFVFIHNLFANKFERFLIPILPLILWLIIPAIKDMLLAPQVSKFRKVSFWCVNGILFVATTFFEPQASIMDLVRFANRETNLNGYVSVNEAISWYPNVFQKRQISLRSLDESKSFSCREALVVRQTQESAVLSQNPDLQRLQAIASGPIDWLAFKLNPAHNQRRAPLVIIGCKSGLHSDVALQIVL